MQTFHRDRGPEASIGAGSSSRRLQQHVHEVDLEANIYGRQEPELDVEFRAEIRRTQSQRLGANTTEVVQFNECQVLVKQRV